MFVSFLLPFHAKNLPAPYLCVLYKQISHLSPEEIVFVGSSDYFQDPESFVAAGRWDVSPAARDYAEYLLPSKEELARYRRYLIPETLCDGLEAAGRSNEEIVRQLLTGRVAELEEALEQCFVQLLERERPLAVLTWCNVPSLTAVAARFGLPVIHNELGPLRKPCYHDTAYFDFQGVNGNTEARARFQQFCTEAQEAAVSPLTRSQLLDLALVEPSRPLEGDPAFEVGIPLQVENDSNIIAFSNGWDNLRLIGETTSRYGRQQSLIRRHPGGLRDYPDTNGILDRSRDSLEFLLACRRVVTINSSVGLEALLLGKETVILGDSPFAFATANELDAPAGSPDDRQRLLALNFILFGYLIPFELLYDQDYFLWRLTRPCELEIYRFHQDYLLSRRRLLEGGRFPSSGATIVNAGLLRFGIRQVAAQQRQARRIAELEKEVARLEEGVRNLTGTLSWRITAPLRQAGRALGWRREG